MARDLWVGWALALVLGAGSPGAASAGPSPTSIEFGGQSMGTTSPPVTVTFTNTTAAGITVNGVSTTNAQFVLTHGCGSLAAGASCSILVAFSPAPASGPLGSTVDVSGTLSISSTSAGSPHAVALHGVSERSLVTHYYRSILRRAPDAGGKAYWEGEAQRLAQIGANVSEAWFAMAMAFYSSAEYAALSRDTTGFVTDLYNTFFNRLPDPGGLAHWTGQVDGGMPREVALVSFMFSTEFASFTRAIFAAPVVRAEIDTVVDFYRGLLARLPDSGGFAFWLERFRGAQCDGAASLQGQVEAISSAYAGSPEYLARGRTNAQYVGDLYNAFLRRGGDLGGVQFWIGRIDSGALTREQVRQQFMASPEFTARVSSIVAAGCAGRHLLATRSIFAAFDRRGWPNGYWSGDLVRRLGEFDQELANSIGAGNVAATIGAEVDRQLDLKKAMGANAINFELRATDSQYVPGFEPPTCNVPPVLGLTWPQPASQDLAKLRAFFDRVHAKGMRILLMLNNTNMQEHPPTGNTTWISSILDAIKDHPAFDTVFFGGDRRVNDFGNGPSCGIPAEPPLWLGPGEYAARYVKWAIGLAHGLGIPYRKLSAEAVVGNYFVDRNQFRTIATLKQVYDELGIPAAERTYGLSIYSHRRCLDPNNFSFPPCTEADPDAWANETLQDIVSTVGTQPRLVAAEWGNYNPSDAGWDWPRAVESLSARMAQHGVEGGSYWIWTQTDAGRDTQPAIAGEAVRRRGLGDVFNPVRKELIAAYGLRLGGLANPSFELGGANADSWTGSGAGTVARFRLADEPGQPAVPLRGSFALRLTTAGGPNDAVSVLSDLSPVAAGLTYTTTANLRFQWSGDGASGPSPSRPHVYVAVRYFAADGTPSSVRVQDVFRFFQEDAPAGFGTFPVAYSPPADAHRVRLEFGAARNGLAQPISVEVDNVR